MDSLRKPSGPKQTIFSQKEHPVFHTTLPPQSLPDRFSLSAKKPTIPKARKYWRDILLFTTVLFFFVSSGVLIFYFVKSLSVGHAIQLRNEAPSSLFADMKQLAISYLKNEHASLRGETSGRINILLLGRAGEHYPGKNLTDTVMMMSIDTASKKISLLSLPRDLYAPIPETTLYTKINSLYQYGLSQDEGIEPLRTSITEITGQHIDYFFVLDFDGFEKAVDALGGIEVDVLRDFYDPRYPGKNYSYETFEIKKGWQTLDGATALKYVRERHNDPEGDFGRAKRQQQVIQAIKDKAFSAGTFLNIFTVNALLDALGENVKTDMPLNDMERFLSLAKTLDTENISSIVIDAWKKESLLRVSHIQVGPIAAFILVPRVGNWSEIRDISENIFRLDVLEARQKEIASEQPTVTLLYAPKDSPTAEKMRRLIKEELHFSEVSLAPQDTLENPLKQSIIIDRTGLRKPYSLDELIKKFTLEKKDDVSFATAEQDVADFIIIIGDDLVETFSFDETGIQSIVEDASFAEPLPPQEKPKKKK